MALAVREMKVSEVDIVIDYFLGSPPEHLEMLGVDPTRLPTPGAWRERLHHQFSLPMNARVRFPARPNAMCYWELSADRIFELRQDQIRPACQHAFAHRKT